MKLSLALWLALSCAFEAHAQKPCFQYLQDGVELSGTVFLKTFFGPPNYGEDPKTDAREQQALLRLDHPFCVNALPSDYDEAEKEQHVVTLVPLGRFDLGPFAGKHVVVSGSLFHANTAHHHTPVLIDLRTPPQVK